MSKKTIRGAVVIGATVLAVFGLAGPAQASSATVYTTQGGGFLEYQDGLVDYFYLRDYLADGYGVRGEIRSGGGTLLSWNYVGGAGNSDSWEYDLAKGKDYVIRVCLASGTGDSTPINCASKVIRDN